MEYSHDLAEKKCLIIWRFGDKKLWGIHTILLFALIFSFDRVIKEFDTKYCANIII